MGSKGRATVSGLGNAISKVVTVGEILKRRVPGLHQYLDLYTAERKYTFEPKEEGLEQKEETRNLTAVKLTLSKAKDAKIKGHYQAPIDKAAFDEIQKRAEEAQEKRAQREAEGGGEREERGDRGRWGGGGRGEGREPRGISYVRHDKNE